MFKIITTKKFDKQFAKCLKRGVPEEEFKEVARQLMATGTVEARYKPHKLVGNFAGLWECHIKPDWLLLWKEDGKNLIILMVQTGTHSDIFG